MPNFKADDRVTVRHNNPRAPSNMYGWEGTVILPQQHGVVDDAGKPKIEQWYMVAFDGQDEVRACPEEWLDELG